MPANLALPQIQVKKSDLEDPSLTLLNQMFQNITSLLNQLSGSPGGTTQVTSHLDLTGNNIKNLADPVAAKDAVSKAYADANYGPVAIRKQLDILGNTVMQSMRRLNDTVQRETTSSYLNALMSTAPTTNTSQISFAPPSGGTVAVTITAGVHQKVDGSIVAYGQLNDTVSQPTTYNLTSLSRVGTIVSVVAAVPEPFVPGESVAISGGNALSDSSFIGTFVILTAPNATHFTYQQFAPDATATGGQASLGGVYYYALQDQSNQLFRVGPFGVDSQSNRLAASIDGQTIIATAIITGAGGDTVNSAAGASPPQSGANAHILFRL